MKIPVLETKAYEVQVANILEETQRQGVKNFLSHYPYMGDEVTVGNFSFLVLNWDSRRGIKITYLAPTAEDQTLYLLSITEGHVQFTAEEAQKKSGILQKLGIGISSRLIVDLLLKLAEATGWFD